LKGWNKFQAYPKHMKLFTGGFFMQVIDAIKTRRSTRKFADKELDRTTIDAVIEAGRYAPSAGNAQTTHFLVVSNREILNDLEEKVKDVFASMDETPGLYKSLVHSIRLSKNGNYLYDYKAPVLIITANQKDYVNNITDCACALENMMIEANELDLGSCWINQLRWLNENKTILQAMYELGMEESERVYGALALGYPATEDHLPCRKALERTGNKVTYID
jgi:nitroreductase